MTSFFLSVVNISIVAAVVSLAVILLRLLLKKAPRWITCLLWALVGLRLVFPFAPESEFSLIPSTDVFTVQSSMRQPDTLKVHTGITTVNSAVNEQISTSAHTQQMLSALDIVAIVWISVAAAVLIYGIVSYLFLFFRVRTAIPLKNNIYQSENVKSPFVLGFVKPKIYIPFTLKGRTLKYVLSHEEAHLKRKDHIVKPFAFLLLSLHWFNPFMWLSYVLLCRDIEVACDERVIKDYSINKRKNYAFALLDCKVNRSNIAVCPIAFGEVNVATRIKKTLCYKKSAVWVVVAAVAVSIISAGCLLTNPKAESYYVKELPPVEITYPVETTEASSEGNLTESSTSAETAVETEATETQAADVTETEPAYSAEVENEDVPENTYEEPFTIQSFDEYFAEQVQAQIDQMVQTRLENLIKETSNHSDECLCHNCDELREAGYKPMVFPDFTQPPVTQPTESYGNDTEYFYYEYGDSPMQEDLELEIPTINN